MQVFAHVVQSKSFTKTSVHFSVTPTMVGKHIKFLESQLGARLLYRTTRKQSLTEVGSLYFLECQRILDDIMEAENSVQTFEGLPKGTVRINCPVTFGNITLSPIVASFLKQYPDINIDLTLDNKLIDPLHDRYDIIIRIGELVDSTIIARHISDYQMVFCASPEYLVTHGAPKTLDDLMKHSCLGFRYEDIQANLALGIDTMAFNQQQVRLASNSGQALKVAGLQGTGILLQPQILLQEEIDKGQLIEILQEYKPASMPIYLLYKTKQQPLKNRTFIEFVLQKMLKL